MGIISGLIVLRVGAWITSRVPRRLRRQLLMVVIGLVTFLVFLWLQAPDSRVRLAFNFHAGRAAKSVREASTSDKDAWLRRPGLYEIDLADDNMYLIKTGYGTRKRVPVMMKAYADSGAMLGYDGYIISGDWDGIRGDNIEDGLERFWELAKHFQINTDNHHRRRKYDELASAIKAGEEEKALSLGKKNGWELDALKFMPGINDMFLRMPFRKWYIILDDDTYLVRPTLERLLTHLDPGKPLYMGNAVGDYAGRFAHGGSAIILSREAVRRLIANQKVFAQSLQLSLDETWGDKLVATTFQKLGIYLDERYSHYFNGEPPELVKITPDRICSPIVSFHSLRSQTAMTDIATKMKAFGKPVTWGQLLNVFAVEPQRAVVIDRVGPLDNDERPVTWTKVKSADACRKKCVKDNKRTCLAWKYNQRESTCHGVPWVVPGVSLPAGDDITASGVNEMSLNQLLARCTSQ